MTLARGLAGGVGAALLAFGGYDGEPEIARGQRRLFVGALWVSLAVFAAFVVRRLVDGHLWAAVVVGVQFTVHASVLLALRVWPRRLFLLANVVFVFAVVAELATTYIYGGIFSAGVTVLWAMITVLINLILFGSRPAVLWFGAFTVAVLAAAWMEEHVSPIYQLDSPALDAAINVILAMAVTLAVTVYFTRQRDQFRRLSDELLHNILPDDIAARLKTDRTMIADDYEAVSVLFADVVGFTPMSAGMSPPQLVGLLNNVFSTFDGMVADLGLEKIKTVGDEYMVASGVPHPRSDHADAIAKLALRIRDHAENHEFDGHRIRLRIGINSGPVVAGIVGTHKFSYDLWGDVVNTASRMESEGVPGSIQITAATYDLIRSDFVCEPRGAIRIKGKGEMNTYFLLSANSQDETSASPEPDRTPRL